MDALNRHRECPSSLSLVVGLQAKVTPLVRSEGGAECARLQEANGTGGGGYASTTSPTPSQSQSPPPPQRAKIRGGGGGRGEEQDSAVFKRDQGQEVQWGLVGMGAVSL